MQVDEENDSSELAMTSAAQDALDRMQQQVENNSGTKPSIGPDPLEAYGPPPPSSNTVTEAMVFSDDFSDEEDNSPPTSPSDMLEDYFETRSSTNSMMHHSSQEGEEPDARIRNHNSEIFDDPTDLSETNTGPFPADEERDNDLFCVSAAKPTAHGEDAGVITAPNKNTTVLSSDGDFGDFNGHLVQEEENEIDPSHVASFDEPSKNPSFEDVQTNILLTKEDDFGDFGVSDMSTKEDPGILNIESPETTQVAPALPEASTEDVEDDFGAFNDAAQDAETELDTTNEELLSPSDPSFEGAAAEDEDDFGDFGGYSTPAQEDPVTPIETEPAETLTQEEVVELESSTPAVQIETEENEFGDFDDAVFDIRNANDTTNADNDTTAPQVNILKTEDLKEGVVDEDEFGDFDEPQDVEHGRLENGDAAEVQPGLETGIVVDEEFGDFDEAGTDDFGDFEEVKTDEGTKSGAQVEETQPKPPSVKGDMNERWEAVFGEYNMRKSSQRKEKCSWRVSNAEEVLDSIISKHKPIDLDSVSFSIEKFMLEEEGIESTSDRPEKLLDFNSHYWMSENYPSGNDTASDEIVFPRLENIIDDRGSKESGASRTIPDNSPDLAPQQQSNEADSEPAATVVKLPPVKPKKSQPEKPKEPEPDRVQEFLDKIPDLSYMLSSKLELPPKDNE